jgi:hypothetical protein
MTYKMHGSACRGWTSVLVALALLAVSAAARAEVTFQNPGNTMGWGRLFTQKGGTIAEVASPVYRGSTAVRTTQTYMTSDGLNYHSEIIKNTSQLAGQDLYYGHAFYLPADWQFHDQNVTFQQWAPEDPAGPWILMFVQSDQIRVGGTGIGPIRNLGALTNLRGSWIRVVTRIHMATDGAFEVWVNGAKALSVNGDFRARGPSLRWSSGIYCTRWDTEAPLGQRELSIFHDNLRIATSYDEAEPANWDGGNIVAPPADGGPRDATGDGAGDGGDGAAGDGAGAEVMGGAGGSGGAGGAGGSGSGGSGGAAGGTGGSGGAATGGSGGTGGSRAGTGGAAGRSGSGGSSAPPAADSGSCGCRVDRASGPDAAPILLVSLLFALALRRRNAASTRSGRRGNCLASVISP